MLFTVHMLDIHQIFVQPGKQGVDAAVIRTGHALQRRAVAFVISGMQHIPREFRLAETFTSGEGEPSAGSAVIIPVFIDGLHDLSDGSVLPDDLDAAVSLPHLLNAEFLRFRIAAPPAAENASLQEYDGPDAFPVMDGIALDVEDPAFCL